MIRRSGVWLLGLGLTVRDVWHFWRDRKIPLDTEPDMRHNRPMNQNETTQKRASTNAATGTYTTYRTAEQNAADFSETDFPQEKFGATHFGAKVHAMYRMDPVFDFWTADGTPDASVTNPASTAPTYAPRCGTRNNAGTRWTTATRGDVDCSTCKKRMG